jgi:hypothetical protein
MRIAKDAAMFTNVRFEKARESERQQIAGTYLASYAKVSNTKIKSLAPARHPQDGFWADDVRSVSEANRRDSFGWL